MITCLREEHRWGELRRASLSRQFALPDHAEAYIDFIDACGAEGDEPRRAEAEGAFFERFGGDTRALLQLGEHAANDGRVATTRRVADRCRALGRDEAAATFLLMGAQLQKGTYQDVLDTWRERGARVSQDSETYTLMLGGLRAAALYEQGQELEAEQWVARLCVSRLLPTPILLSLAEQFQRAGQTGAAIRVLRHAAEIDPLNRPVTVLLLRHALKSGAMDEVPPLVTRLLTMRKPPPDLLDAVLQALTSDRYLYLPDRAKTLAAIRDYQERRRQ